MHYRKTIFKVGYVLLEVISNMRTGLLDGTSCRRACITGGHVLRRSYHVGVHVLLEDMLL